jgi:hypothetical protein
VDHRRFDALTQSVASRRSAIHGGIGLLFGAFQPSFVEAARCKRAGSRCGRQKTCCAGARCKGGRCRCKPGSPLWAGVCCRDRFSEVDVGQDPSEGTQVCCPAARVCPKSSDPAEDDCCLGDEVCVDGVCCCDGCRGTVVCGGACCASAACCNGVCCGSDQVCAETSPGVRACVPATRSCTTSDTSACFAGERCWEGVCCAGERICSGYNGSDPPSEVCCSSAEYCDSAVACCAIGVGCSTGRKVRIRV